jgi:hypothetical protein
MQLTGVLTGATGRHRRLARFASVIDCHRDPPDKPDKEDASDKNDAPEKKAVTRNSPTSCAKTGVSAGTGSQP